MANRLSKIVTRTGDDGTTGLADGTRVSKDDMRIALIGNLDELNSRIGLLLSEVLIWVARWHCPMHHFHKTRYNDWMLPPNAIMPTCHRLKNLFCPEEHVPPHCAMLPEHKLGPLNEVSFLL